MRRKRGFTLIELLVVVAIIALLIAILLPSLGKARSKAQTAKCLANVRGLGSAAQIYITDYSMLLPYVETPDKFWVNILKTYANIDKIRICPSTSAVGGDPPGNNVGTASLTWASGETGNVGWDKISQHDYLGSYGLNGYVEAPTSGAAFASQTNPAATAAWYWHYPFTRSTTTIPIFSDSIWYDGWPHGQDGIPVNAAGTPTTVNPTIADHMGRFCLNRHNMAVNLSFMDGHGETIQLKNLWTLTWNTQWGNTSVGEGVPNPLYNNIPKN